MRRFLALAMILLAIPLTAETPRGLLTLPQETIMPSPEHDWKRLGIGSWELKLLERVYRQDGVEAWNVGYKSGDLNIAGYFARPIGVSEENPGPAVILCHGSTRGVTQAYREVALEFARRGYVVAASGYRGHAGMSGRSEGVRQFAKGETLDVFQLTQLVRKLEYVDSQRLAVWGQGEGGAIAAQMLGRSNVFAAAVLVAPVVVSGSPEYGFAGLRRYSTIAQGVMGRSLSEGELVRQMMDRDAFRNIPQISTPILLIAPEDDPGFNEMGQWVAALKAKGKQVEVLRYPNMWTDFMTAVDTGSRPNGWREARDNAWTNTFNWIETYAPPN